MNTRIAAVWGEVVRNSTRASGEDDQVLMPSGVGKAEAREAPGPRTGG